MIQDWLVTKGLLKPNECVQVTLKVEKLPQVEVTVEEPAYDFPDSVTEKCAVRIQDLELPRSFSKYIDEFITVGQLTRFSERGLIGRKVPGHYGRIGATTVKNIRQLLSGIGLEFDSNLPLHDSELQVILAAPSELFLNWPMIILSEEFPTIQSLVDADREYLQERTELLLKRAKAQWGNRFASVTSAQILTELTTKLTEFTLKLK